MPARGGAGARAGRDRQPPQRPSRLDDGRGAASRSLDNHLAETASATLDREIDYSLEENEERVLAAIDAALARIAAGTYGRCERCGQRDRGGAPGGASLRDALHRGQAPGRARLSRWTDESRFAPASARTRSPRSRSPSARSPQSGGSGSASRSSRSPPSSPTSSRSTSSRASIRLDSAVKLIGPVSIRHVQNSGIAFGLFSSATAIVIVLTTVAVGWMLVFFARSGARHPALPVALGLLIGGSVSNLVDRVRLGYVTDFLDLRWWPAFNLADASIVVGVAVLLGSLLLADGSPRRRADTLGGASLIRVRVADDAAGLRLDRFLAGLDAVGSRAAAERLLDAGGGASSTGLLAPSRTASRRVSRSSSSRPAPVGARRRSRSTSASPTRTSTCSSWTSPRASPSIPARATRPGRSCTRSLGRTAGGDEPRAAGDRPPARPRHVRPHGRRADRGGLPPPAVARPPPPARARVPRARARAAALAEREDRGRDRARPRRADPPVARHGHAARRRHALRGRRAPPAARAAASAARDRAHAPDPRPPRRDRPPGRRATASTACATSTSTASSCTPRASRSRTRSPASRSRPSRRSRSTSPPRSSALAPPSLGSTLLPL